MDREKQAGKTIIGHIVAFIRCFPYVAIVTRKNTEPNLAVILSFPSCCFFFSILRVSIFMTKLLRTREAIISPPAHILITADNYRDDPEEAR